MQGWYRVEMHLIKIQARNQPIQDKQFGDVDSRDVNIDFHQRVDMDLAMAPNLHLHANRGRVFHLHSKKTKTGRS